MSYKKVTMKKIKNQHLGLVDCISIDRFAGDVFRSLPEAVKLDTGKKAKEHEIEIALGIVKSFESVDAYLNSGQTEVGYQTREDIASLMYKVMRAVNSVFVLSKNDENMQVLSTGVFVDESFKSGHGLIRHPFKSWKGVHVEFAIGQSRKIDVVQRDFVWKLATERDLFIGRIFQDNGCLFLYKKQTWNVFFDEFTSDTDNVVDPNQIKRISKSSTVELGMSSGYIEPSIKKKVGDNELIRDGVIVFSGERKEVSVQEFREMYKQLIKCQMIVDDLLLKGNVDIKKIGLSYESIYKRIKELVEESTFKRQILESIDAYLDLKYQIGILDHPLEIKPNPSVVGVPMSLFKKS